MTLVLIWKLAGIPQTKMKLELLCVKAITIFWRFFFFFPPFPKYTQGWNGENEKGCINKQQNATVGFQFSLIFHPVGRHRCPQSSTMLALYSVGWLLPHVIWTPCTLEPLCASLHRVWSFRWSVTPVEWQSSSAVLLTELCVLQNKCPM